MRSRALWTYLCLLHLAVLAIAYRPLMIRLRPGPEEPAHYANAVTAHRRILSQTPPGRVLYFGDSITEGLYVDAISRGGVNLGIGSDQVPWLLQRLPADSVLLSAAAVVVAIGINDMHYRTDMEIIRDYRSLLGRIPAGIPTVWSAVLPVESRLRDAPRVTPERIQGLNSAAQSLCNQRLGCIFLDVGSSLAGSDGQLLSRFHEGDGIHLSAAGYAVLAAGLRKALREATQRIRRANTALPSSAFAVEGKEPMRDVR